VSRWYPHHLVIIGRDYTAQPRREVKRIFPRRMSRSFIRLSLYLTQSSTQMVAVVESGALLSRSERISNQWRQWIALYSFPNWGNQGAPWSIYEILSCLIFLLSRTRRKWMRRERRRDRVATNHGGHKIDRHLLLRLLACHKNEFQQEEKKKKRKENFNKC